METPNFPAAGLSIGVGLIRILFPESKQFLEAKAAGKKAASAGAFWRDLKKMLKQEWRMAIYCIILMTWVCSVSPGQTTSVLTHRLLVQLLLAHFARLVHYVYARTEGARQRRCVPCFHPDEGGSLCWRHNHWLRLSISWSSTSHHFLSPHLGLPHPRVDPP
jgi:hypothetical protein